MRYAGYRPQLVLADFLRVIRPPPSPRAPGSDVAGPAQALRPSRARHKAWAGLGLGLEKWQACEASQARAWIYMAKSVPMCQQSVDPPNYSGVQCSEQPKKNPNFVVGTFAWAQARAQGFRPRTQGSGSGLENLKPEPAQAEPKPGHSGRAGPATSRAPSGKRTRRDQLLREPARGE
ncbi:hypothetical protein B0H16DRAFT_1484315 [Mycena metata]|uniref:Uncharacterized protein n=1 Tax=Mycena metata TaxID=1033252 RepID=A0AAD7DVK0_9AGAR|nr:hypothetical protein B0H16DRAFT_1484315 [Mycena metata]